MKIKYMKKRIFSILLAICMVLAAVPILSTTSALAGEMGYEFIDGTKGNTNQGPEKLVDGDSGSKWCVSNFSKGYIIFSTASSINVSGYTITTGNDNASYPDRNPNDWVLYGSTATEAPSKDADSWEVIHRVTNDTILQDANKTPYNYVFDKTETAYKYFKLEINGTKGSDVMQLGEFELTSCDHQWQIETVPTTADQVGYTQKTCQNCGGINKQFDIDNAITLTLANLDGKGWKHGQLVINRDGKPWQSLTLNNKLQWENVYLPYSSDSVYSFYWYDDSTPEEGIVIVLTSPKEPEKQYIFTGFVNSPNGSLLYELNYGDYTAVNEAIDAVPEDLSIYTTASVQALRNAVDAVDWNLPCKRQDEIDGMAAAINSANANLVVETATEAEGHFNLSTASADLFITESGYRWGDNGTEIPYSGAYSLHGKTKRSRVIVESGSHDITFCELYLTKEDEYPFSIQPNASVSLTLVGENQLQQMNDKGISITLASLNVSEGAKLEITEQSTGSLLALSENGAGIGGNTLDSFGSITINGGTITAQSEYGAAIGGGSNSNGNGSIIINGGTVNAHSEYGAAIGSGYDSQGRSTVIIKGGAVNAQTTRGAAIGGGSNSQVNSTIIIGGGTITAQGTDGAGIGGGYYSQGKSTITVNGGTVDAKSYKGAGIGSGYWGWDSANIIINDGTISGRSEYGAGIGVGYDSGEKASDTIVNNIIIKGGNVTGESGDSAGIGINYLAYNNCAANLKVSGGNVKAECDSSDNSIGIVANSILIEGGTVNAIGNKGDTQSCGITVIDDLTINGGTVNAIGGSAGGCSSGIYFEYGDCTFIISGGSVLAQATEGADWCEAALYTEPDLSGYNYYKWRTSADGNYTKGNFLWDEYPYLEIVPYTPSSGSRTYPINIELPADAKGTLTASPDSASKGDTVTLTVLPEKGYTLETLTVTDNNGNPVEVTNNGDGTYSFTMPNGNVNISATFMEDNTMLNFFVDVFPEDYYYDAVYWAVENGITTGIDDTHFDPNADCTRAQAVTFLWRAAGSPQADNISGFVDVPADSYYAQAVAWAVEAGIAKGVDDTHFAPNDTCDRNQIVTLLWRLAGSPKADNIGSFVDVPADSYYAEAVYWALEKGITTGTDATHFSPNDICTRGQIVTFLFRALAK